MQAGKAEAGVVKETTMLARIAVGLVWLALLAQTASAAESWGAFKADACTAMGFRQYSAILYGIPGGTSWEDACARMPADINGVHFDKPSRCKNTQLNEWGEFDVPDKSCPHWGPFKADACSLVGKRQFSSILYDIPPGTDWKPACLMTGGTVAGFTFQSPNRCTSQTTAEWGEVDVPDPTCNNPTDLAHSVSLGCPPGFQCVIPAPRYLSIFWDGPEQWDADVTAAGLPAETKAALQKFLANVTASDYFSGLSEYGVRTPSYAGTMEPSAACLAAFPVRPAIDFQRISQFVACMLSPPGSVPLDNLIVAVFLPPQVNPEWVDANLFGAKLQGFSCNTYKAYHAFSSLGPPIGAGTPTVPIMVIPATTACNASFGSIEESISHEMVESATDPFFTGWLDHATNDIVGYQLPLFEISDMCETIYRTDDATPPYGTIAPYWSNKSASCITRAQATLPPPPPPPPDQCRKTCDSAMQRCMQDAHSGPARAQCGLQHNQCLADCR